MNPTVVKVIFIGGLLVASGLIQLGRWLEVKMSDATAREYKRVWTEEIRPMIEWSESDWPPAGHAEDYFFETPPKPEYDPRADAAEYITYMWLETQDYIDRLRRDEH